MKITKGFITAAIVGTLATSSFAATIPVSDKLPSTVTQQEQVAHYKQQDPIKALEHKKTKIKEQLKAGELTPAEANKKIAKIDAKIEKIKEFNALPLPQRKEKILHHLQEVMEKKVKEKKITQEEAEQRLKQYQEKIDQWDGTGFPKLREKY